jgi:hypothetical protein
MNLGFSFVNFLGIFRNLCRYKLNKCNPNFLFCCYRYPYVTGTSVVAIKYKDGILMASDMGG